MWYEHTLSPMTRATPKKARLCGEYLPTIQFVLAFGSFQALYYIVGDEFGLARQPEEPLPGKTIVIVDGSKMAENPGSATDYMLNNPEAVLTFDSKGMRVENQFDRERKRQRDAQAAAVPPPQSPSPPPAPPEPEPAEPAPSPSSTPPPTRPAPPSTPKPADNDVVDTAAPATTTTAGTGKAATATAGAAFVNKTSNAANSTADADSPPRPEEGAEPADCAAGDERSTAADSANAPAGATDSDSTEDWATVEEGDTGDEEGEGDEDVFGLEDLEDEAGTGDEGGTAGVGGAPANRAAQAEAEAREWRPEAAQRRPAYLWAQNASHVFVTVRLAAGERRREPDVRFESRRAVFALSPTPPEEGVRLVLELLRPVEPAGCSWTRTGRGALLRIAKAAPRHWPRLLASERSDGKQGIDWTRWQHPLAEEAERSEAQRAEFGRLNARRVREVRRMMPIFEELLKDFQAARGGWAGARAAAAARAGVSGRAAAAASRRRAHSAQAAAGRRPAPGEPGEGAKAGRGDAFAARVPAAGHARQRPQHAELEGVSETPAAAGR